LAPRRTQPGAAGPEGSKERTSFGHFKLLGASSILPVHGELTGSAGYRSLIQATAVPPLPVRTEVSWWGFPQAPVQPRRPSMAVIVTLKIDQLRLQIGCVPQQDAVELLAANRAMEDPVQRHSINHAGCGRQNRPA
jgi:hypothetical protein